MIGISLGMICRAEKINSSYVSRVLRLTLHQAKEAGTLVALPNELKAHSDQIFQIIDSVFSDAQLPKIASSFAWECTWAMSSDPGGDLNGDGINIAAWLEKHAPVGRSASTRRHVPVSPARSICR